METGSASDGAHLRDYLRVIFRRKWLTAATFLLIVAPAAIASYFATPTYEARARLVIERQNPRPVGMQDPSPGDPNPEFFQTQVQIIHSRPLAASVIDALELTKKKPGLAQATDPPTAWLQSSVRVAPVTNTRLIEISVTDSDPELAAAGRERACASIRRVQPRAEARRFAAGRRVAGAPRARTRSQGHGVAVGPAEVSRRGGAGLAGGEEDARAEEARGVESRLRRASAETTRGRGAPGRTEEGRERSRPDRRGLAERSRDTEAEERSGGA